MLGYASGLVQGMSMARSDVRFGLKAAVRRGREARTALWMRPKVRYADKPAIAMSMINDRFRNLKKQND